MKKLSGGAIFGIIVLALALILGIWGVSSYNGLVGLQETVNSQSSNIDTQLQRRSDLIPNLVNTVKGYTSHESEILTAIADSRSKLAGASTMSEKAQADTELSGALSRLLVVIENYPNLKADTQFTALIDEIARTENRIAVARKDYNASVKDYNQKIKTFPSNILAGMFGFSAADYFEASAKSGDAPAVNFNN